MTPPLERAFAHVSVTMPILRRGPPGVGYQALKLAKHPKGVVAARWPPEEWKRFGGHQKSRSGAVAAIGEEAAWWPLEEWKRRSNRWKSGSGMVAVGKVEEAA